MKAGEGMIECIPLDPQDRSKYTPLASVSGTNGAFHFEAISATIDSIVAVVAVSMSACQHPNPSTHAGDFVLCFTQRSFVATSARPRRPICNDISSVRLVNNRLLLFFNRSIWLIPLSFVSLPSYVRLLGVISTMGSNFPRFRMTHKHHFSIDT
jgi:hypothetical protein